MSNSGGKDLTPEQKQCQAILSQAKKETKPLEQQLANLQREEGYSLKYTPPGMDSGAGKGTNSEKAKELEAAIENIKSGAAKSIEKLTADLPLEAKEETRADLSKWLYPRGRNEINPSQEKQPEEALKSAFIQRYDKRKGEDIERSLPKDMDASQEMLADALLEDKSTEPEAWNINAAQKGFFASKATFAEKLRQKEMSLADGETKSEKTSKDEKENELSMSATFFQSLGYNDSSAREMNDPTPSLEQDRDVDLER